MILVAHSNFMVQDEKQRARMKPYAPLSTLIAAALLRDEGYEVAMFDATFEPGIAAFESMLDRERPAIVAIMEDNFNFLTKMCTTVRRETAFAMIAAARLRDCRVAVNGPDSSDDPASYLAAGADAVVLGEGERALLELVACWRRGAGDPAQVAGLVLPGLGRTAPRPGERDLDALPHPAWHMIDAGSYRDAWQGAQGEFSWNVATSRGCPYRCNWCAKPTFGRGYAIRSAEDVVRELVSLRSSVRPDHIWFTDDIFGLEPGWIERFASAARRSEAIMPFTMQSRVNLMTPATVAALADAGAREVWLGVESGSQAILDAMDKGSTLAEAREATRLLKYHGIRACWFIQLGYPSESWEDLLATRELVRDEAPDDIGVSVAYPLPGTEFHDRVRAQLGMQRNWRDTGDLAMLFQGTFDTAFYRKVRDLLHHEVNSGLPDRLGWERLARSAHRHRSPAPFRLAAAESS